MLRPTQLSLTSLGLWTLALLGPLGCTDDTVENPEGGGSCELLAGDLVISEIVADVEGPDKGLEWFEIYNASSSPIELEGRTLVYSRADGTRRKTHTIARSLELAPGGYLTVGAMLDEITQGVEHLDYGYGEDLGEFGNSGGYLAIECEGEIVDEVFYADVVPTASRVFDGSRVPDAVANDYLDSWCDSRTEFSPGFAATPRAPNDVCGSQTTCLLDGESVPVIPPAPGELLITEVMANPDAVGDAVGEWFEIHSLATAEFHLNGVEIGRSLDSDAQETVAAAECIVIAPGSYAIMARSRDENENGGLPAEAIVWQTGVSLTNTDGSLWLGAEGELLDAVTWTTARAGEATQLDPGAFDPIVNDELGNWCDATTPYGLGDLGTPGAANLQCASAPTEGQCDDNGRMRDIVPVELGNLVINEVHPDPAVVADADGEWFELLVKGPGDLNGLQIGKAGSVSSTVAAPHCIAVDAGQYVVLARKADPAVNGGLPQVDAVFNMALNNSNSDLFIGYGGEVWDQVTWSSSTAGRARSLSFGNITPESNDDEAAWCEAVDLYGDGDYGTPGVQNPVCEAGPVEGACLDPDTNMMRSVVPPALGDLMISEVMANPSTPEPGGEWFELYASAAFDLNGLELGKGGAISHTVSSATCLEVAADSYVVLARSDVDANNCSLPQVDYVYASLTLNNSNSDLQIGYGGEILAEYAWASTQDGVGDSYDMDAMSWCPSVEPFGCGDLGTPGAENPACGGGMGMEGMCFDGDGWREIVVPVYGDVVISEIMANPSGAEPANEWFELRALASFDLNGLWLGRDHMADVMNAAPMHLVDSADCLSVSPGETALFARSNDPATNGGLPPVTYVYSSPGLNNSNSGLYVATEFELLDQVSWSTTSDGRSTSLDPASYDPALNDIANNAAPWCFTPAVVDNQYGAGGHGTPNADNLSCG
ncbi:MAG: lamin tail domain-containing protein [Enhygromyxa sp.]